MDAVENFAREAAAFEQWLLHGRDTGADAVRECLIRLLALMRAAMELPPELGEELDEDSSDEDVPQEQWEKALEAAHRLPLDFYGIVFDPFPVPPGEATVGSVADDLADIWRDLAAGLRAHENGKSADAAWEWRFGFLSHWGRHACGAVPALHAWLRQNAAHGPP